MSPEARAAAAFVGMLVLTPLLGGCGGATEPTYTGPIGGESGKELAEIQVLRRGNGAEPQTLDPHRGEGVPSANLHRDLFEGLTIEAPDGRVIPGVAESWEVSEDGTVYMFRLRRNAKWSNGEPVTAHDFEFGFRRSVDPMTLSNYSSILEPIVNATEVIRGEKPPEELGVEAVDDYTFVIRLNGPTPYLPGLLNHSTTYPVNRKNIEEFGSKFIRGGNLVSNGAYQLVEWIPQSYIQLVRNEHYWDNDNTTIDTVYYYPTENQDSELKRFRAGELDITEDIPQKQIAWVRENFPDSVRIDPYLGSYYFGFNVTKPPFKDRPKLRKALAMAIDRKIIAEQVAGAGELPSYGWVPPVTGYEQRQAEWADWTQEEREEEARRLYAEAGFSADNPFKVDLMYNTNENHKRISVAVAAMWKQVLGVETTLTNQEWKVFLDTRNRQEITQVFRGGWIGDYNDPFTFTQLMYSTNEMNHPGYASEEYDELVRRAAAEGDLDKRAKILADAESLLLEDMPIIPVYFYVSTHLVRPWVGGREPNIMDHHYTKNLYILKH
ncbi:MAG: peptide ABC transporter substrate-binding protein [Gammaproteobacteria bacterium]|nr:peptide ABC transporter substrate-binding protein [Gammaproteobacteria bacterium]